MLMHGLSCEAGLKNVARDVAQQSSVCRFELVDARPETASRLLDMMYFLASKNPLASILIVFACVCTRSAMASVNLTSSSNVVISCSAHGNSVERLCK